MPDYIYLLENRLSADQQNALRQLREAAREAGMILFLTGDAVRELTSGHAVRNLEVAVHGNALKLKKTIESLGGSIWGESEATLTLYVCFPGTVRVDVVSTHRMDYTRIDRPVYHPASIQEDLRRRDFTVNAMAISLNEGSFGLLMDPLNGAADIESRTLRLVSNYGFLEEPSLLIRATRYKSRLGWEMDQKTHTRYENAKGDGVIERLSHESQSREIEQIGHEDEALKVLRALEEEGWMKYLFPAWTSAKADEEKLRGLHDLAVELLLQGVHADMSAAQMQLLTAKMSPKDLAALKKMMLRPGFVEEWNSLDAMASKFAKILLSKDHTTASAGYKLLTTYDPEAVLWLAFTSKDKAVQARFNQFLKVWPEARQRIPHALMQEMRITPELATYKEIVQSIFLELIDGRLNTPEEIRAFLEPHSPPAPPPQVTIKRPRAKRGEAKVKERTYDDDEDAEDGLDEDEDLDDLGGDDDDIDLGISLPKVELEPEIESDDIDVEIEADDLDTEPEPVPVKRASKGSSPSKKQKEPSAAPAPPITKAPEVEAKAVPAATPAKPAASAAKSTAPEPVSRKGEKMSKKVAAVAAANTTVSAPGVKPPQSTAQALTANTETVLIPGAKPPQATRPAALTANTLRMPGAKPPQRVGITAAVAKPAPAKTAKPAAKPAPKSAPKPVKKAAPAKAAKPAPKPVKKAAPAKAAKPAPKPVKKAAPAKAAKPAPKAAKKKR